MLFPGVGKGVSGGISQLLGIGGQQLSGPRDMGMAARFAPPERPAGLAENLAGTQAAQAPAAPIQPIGGDIQERRRTTLPGISSMSGMGEDPRLNLGNYDASRMPLDPRLEGLPEISTMESSLYQSPYAAMMREEQDRQKTAVEDLLQYSDIPENLPYIDPFTMKGYATEKERDAAMQQSGSLWEKGVPLKAFRPGRYATGGEIQGPGTGTSDSVPATIYQNGTPVKKAALSDGEFVMTAKAVRGMGNGSRERGVTRMYELMRRFENGEMA
jgi:hypothetical protein